MDLAQLAERIAALETEVATLRRRALTMKQTHRCVCGGTTVLHFKRILHATDGSYRELEAIGKKKSWWKGHAHGAPFEAYVCEACGLAEWHAVSLDEAELDGDVVERLTAPAEPDVGDGPYR